MPFSLDPVKGDIKTTSEMMQEIPTYRFAVQAKDNPGQSTNKNSIDAEVIVSYFCSHTYLNVSVIFFFVNIYSCLVFLLYP